jgi:hypothetical protein
VPTLRADYKTSTGIDPKGRIGSILLSNTGISLNINSPDYLLAGINYNAAHYYYPIKEIGAFALAQ